MTVNRAEYNFEVGLQELFHTIMVEGEQKLTPVTVNNKPRFAVIRQDNFEVLDIVSDVWEGMNHADVVDSVKSDLIPKLNLDIESEKLYMWMNGAIMFYQMTTKKEFTVGGIKLFANINALNSHNRYTKAGVQITLTDEQGTNYLPTVSNKSVYTYESMLHRKGTLDLVKLQKLVDNIPILIDNTIVSWERWNHITVEFPRLYILAQLFNLRLGEYLVAQMPTGGTKFEMYKHICQYMLNNDKMMESGFNALTQMTKFVRIMRNEDLFTCELDDLHIKVKNIKLFDWEEKEKQKEQKKLERETKKLNEVKEADPNTTEVADIGEEEVNEEEIETMSIKQTEDILNDLLS